MRYLLDTDVVSALRLRGRNPVVEAWSEHAPLDDALIAVVAESGGLTVVTRNERHFEPLGVRCLNPWELSTG